MAGGDGEIQQTSTPESAVFVPANLRPYVEVLGVDLAVEFLINFGGGYLYLKRKARGGAAVRMLGPDNVDALATIIGEGSHRIPLGSPYVAKVLHSEFGFGSSRIARILHSSDVAVRRWLADARYERPATKRKLIKAAGTK